MKRTLELIIILVLLYALGAWVEWEVNPEQWHVITRGVMVVIIVLITVVASRPGGGVDPKPGGG